MNLTKILRVLHESIFEDIHDDMAVAKLAAFIVNFILRSNYLVKIVGADQEIDSEAFIKVLTKRMHAYFARNYHIDINEQIYQPSSNMHPKMLILFAVQIGYKRLHYSFNISNVIEALKIVADAFKTVLGLNSYDSSNLQKLLVFVQKNSKDKRAYEKFSFAIFSLIKEYAKIEHQQLSRYQGAYPKAA